MIETGQPRKADGCDVSIYLAVIALNMADFGLAVPSHRIWPLQFYIGHLAMIR